MSVVIENKELYNNVCGGPRRDYDIEHTVIGPFKGEQTENLWEPIKPQFVEIKENDLIICNDASGTNGDLIFGNQYKVLKNIYGQLFVNGRQYSYLLCRFIPSNPITKI